MVEIAVTVARWALKISFFTSIAIAISILIGVVSSYLIAGYNTSVLNDIFGIVQIWLPFNLNILLLWIAIAATAYLAFRLSLMVFNIISAYIGR